MSRLGGRSGKRQRGAAAVEYVLALPIFLLLFLGSLEVFRVISIKQSLRAGVGKAAPYFTHYKEATDHYDNPVWVIQEELDKNRFSRRMSEPRVAPGDHELMAMAYGQVFEIVAEVEVQLGFIYPFENGPTLTLRERYQTFVDSSPAYFELADAGTPFPKDPSEYGTPVVR